ncbi:MAG: DUF892 family protein [Bacteroidota bacterium]
MKQRSKDSSQLAEFFLDSVKDIFWAENHLVKSLPKLKNAAKASQLKLAIDQHLEITRGHVARLVKMFEILGEKPISRRCEAMKGLILEGEQAIEETKEGTAVRDLAINFACLKVEYYEIIVYKGLSDLATRLGYTEVASLLNQTFKEEQESANTLGRMGEIFTGNAMTET